MKDRERLMDSIRDGIIEVRDSLKSPKSLSKYNPEKVATILYLHSIGVTQTQMVRKYGLHRPTIMNILVEYADYSNKWRKLGGTIRGRHFLSLSSLAEDMVDSLREQMEKGETKPTFRDLLPVTVALEKAERGSNTFRGEATKIIEERKVVTQADYEAMIDAARKRMLQLKKVESINT